MKKRDRTRIFNIRKIQNSTLSLPLVFRKPLMSKLYVLVYCHYVLIYHQVILKKQSTKQSARRYMRFIRKSLGKKSVRMRSFSGLYFPAFGLNMERYEVLLCIQSECGKIRTRKTPNTDTFHEVNKH